MGLFLLNLVAFECLAVHRLSYFWNLLYLYVLFVYKGIVGLKFCSNILKGFCLLNYKYLAYFYLFILLSCSQGYGHGGMLYLGHVGKAAGFGT